MAALGYGGPILQVSPTFLVSFPFSFYNRMDASCEDDTVSVCEIRKHSEKRGNYLVENVS